MLKSLSTLIYTRTSPFKPGKCLSETRGTADWFQVFFRLKGGHRSFYHCRDKRKLFMFVCQNNQNLFDISWCHPYLGTLTYFSIITQVIINDWSENYVINRDSSELTNRHYRYVPRVHEGQELTKMFVYAAMFYFFTLDWDN